MIAISEYMKSQGYAPSHAEHTRIPGIWKKLGTLYNLPALDEREDSLIMDGSDDADSSREHYCPFELPQDEYGHLMFERRLAMEGSASPAASDRYRMESRRGSTVADTDEPRSSPAPQRGRKKRGRPARSTRTSKLHIEMEPPKKAAEEDEEGEEEAESENGEEYSTDDDKDDSDEDDDEEEEEDGDVDGEGGGSPTTRHTRAKTSRTRQKEKKGGTMGTRRGGRRR
ncbi:hypothetical protein ASPZODRAFT_128454 [Penicilliopsis zonata CBS 506.65]|uniref:CT20 family protein n=1 Tax=Penicilliopsis zonata CBS 506.65 TaxID=1073090 RepID=A0A1L9SRQ1_9EURO|nr:hypothetical protein ASPZODRAFT_128454 [Penicilliopsis zonata CBS 506.65]OJJ49895.1 hypothetical protein ASPZODRAFT_128454 [Penicilliopsis zonata CBS 506.65]